MFRSATVAPAGGYDVLTDDRLATLAHRGDEGAAAAIHGRYAHALLAYARSIVRDPEDAQDVLQQTMLNALTALARRELRAPLRPWLFRITHNTAISFLRHRRPTDALDDERGWDGGSDSAESELLARERLRELIDDVAALPERQRTALLMHDVAGLPHARVAEELDCTDGASRQTLNAARTALREAAAGRDVPCAEVLRIVRAGDRRRLRARHLQAHLRTCARCGALAAPTGSRAGAGHASDGGHLGELLQGLGTAAGGSARGRGARLAGLDVMPRHGAAYAGCSAGNAAAGPTNHRRTFDERHDIGRHPVCVPVA